MLLSSFLILPELNNLYSFWVPLHPVIPVQPTPKIIDSARALIWEYGLNIKTIDAIHIATAITLNCSAFITTDEKLADLINNSDHRLSIKIGFAEIFSEYLPDKYRQNILELRREEKNNEKIRNNIISK
ncbi:MULTISPECIES: PIN domain-containing protein [Nitrosomonas]|uniref:PIN domain-containing protein n=1 Tax=Nitrosomonas communis TaxID=44574 RepID=A0A0F7KI26_9PROT|nr:MULTISPECIES: PIN domain-containing protein [Nitrosomonas]AKH39176.1 hypothetical protein AAW31_17290 [Nitrosomonas communis]UVS61356.1 PIN domain-containing protein [Nitrosomonas sp. PLL12]